MPNTTSSRLKIGLPLLLITVLLLAGCQKNKVSNSGNQNVPPANNASNNVSGGDRLDLSNQGLTSISQDVFNKTNLKDLNVSGNKLTGALPAEIRQLNRLEILDASDNQMTGVPAEIGQLQNLRVLDLSNNQLTGLPNELGNLKKLETLNLSGNNYSTQDLEIIRAGLPDDVNIIVD